jgi:hypothetical protein
MFTRRAVATDDDRDVCVRHIDAFVEDAPGG